ncbi:hypothetical protein KR026_012262 [Drosophila bipectinata]|nr:hypothetical protein KR026_012262 [Drosophila bipectinata]
MKCILLISCLILYVAYTAAQENCVGRPFFQVCSGGRHNGDNNSRRCIAFAMNEMWYYDSGSRSCKTMKYLGCGGNNNRYCSRDHCRRKCRP